MRIVAFQATTPAEALAQIHAQLGPEAVVLSVRPVPATGLARLWQKNKAVEVLAGVDDPEVTSTADANQGVPLNAPSLDRIPLPSGVRAPAPAPSPAIEPELTTGRKAPALRVPVPPVSAQIWSSGLPEASARSTKNSEPVLSDYSSWEQSPPSQTWRNVTRLESQGLLPVFAQRLRQHLTERHGALPPAEAGAEWPKVRAGLEDFWRPAPPLADGSGRPHIFIGPAGCGKTTLLCKWLACSVLLEEHTARVWRLDGANANTAEILNIYGEMFGVGIERFWHQPESAVDLCLVDLPGVETGDVPALAALESLLATLPSPRIHLVLNAAYDTPILFEQFRTFARFKPEDLSFTHLDEETRPIKLWNFVLGTNCSFRFLCAGQKIPGQFVPAEPGLLFPSHKSLQPEPLRS